METLRVAIWSLLVVIPAAAGATVFVFTTLGAEIPASWPPWAQVAAWTSVGGATILTPFILLSIGSVPGVKLKTSVRHTASPVHPIAPPVGSRTTTIVRDGNIVNPAPATSRSKKTPPKYRTPTPQPAIAGD